MTEPQIPEQAGPPAAEQIPQVPVVTAAAGTKLEQLHAAYWAAKAARDEAEAQLKAVTDGLKLALSQAHPGSEKVNLTGPAGAPLRLTYVESWRIDSRKLKAEDPETYVRYAKKSGSWTLKALSQGAGGGSE